MAEADSSAPSEALPRRNNIRRGRGGGGGDQRTTTEAIGGNKDEKDHAAPPSLPASSTVAEAPLASSVAPPRKQGRNAKASAPSTSINETPPLPPPFSPLKTPSTRAGGRGNAGAIAEGDKAPLSAAAVAERMRAENAASQVRASSGDKVSTSTTGLPAAAEAGASSISAASGGQSRQRGAGRGGRADKADSGIKPVEEAVAASGHGNSEREKRGSRPSAASVDVSTPSGQSSSSAQARRGPASGAPAPPVPSIPTAHSAAQALKASLSAVPTSASTTSNAPLDATRGARQGGTARSRPQAAGTSAALTTGGGISGNPSSLSSANTGSLVPSQVRGSAAASNPPPRFLPAETTGQFIASGPSRQSDNTFADYVPIEQKMSQVTHSKSFKEYFEKHLGKNNPPSITVSHTSGGLPRIEIRGSDSSAVRRARVLIDTFIQHEASLMTLKQKEEGLERELKEYNREVSQGLRCEFEVPGSVLGIIIGKQGANVQRVQADTGVEKIIIDSDNPPHLVRIKGATAASVAAARLQLEYTFRQILATESEITFLTNQDSKRLSAIKTKSRVISIEPVSLPGNKHALEIIGLVSDVETAEVLIQADLDFNREAKKTASTISQLESKVAEMHIGYGERRNGGGDGYGRNASGDEPRDSRQKFAPRSGGGGDRDRRGPNNTGRSNAGSGDGKRTAPPGGGAGATRK